jgi:ribonucleoside-diphosphate reductase, alpha subunit
LENKKWIYLNNEIMIQKDGEYQLEKDKEAVYSYFVDYVNKNTVFFHNLKEKMKYLIKSNYYIDFYEMYSHDEIKEIFKLVYGKKFRFASFMSASKFYQSYALMDDSGEKFLERYEDRISITALYLAQGNMEKAREYATMMINQEYQPATPTFLNSGKKRSGELVSCFLDEMGDSLSDIGYIFDSTMKLSSMGGGVSINLSKIRARGESIKGVENCASGVLPIMKVLEDIFSYANQLNQRPGSGAVYLNVFHSDIMEFLDSKKINVDEKIRIKSLSIGVIIPDKFMQLAMADEACYVFYPHTVYQAYGQYLDEMDMDEMYEKLVDNPKVKKKKINARELLVKISQTQKESGYPYLFFKNNANKEHALKSIGDIKFSNLCTEICQISEVSEINSYYEKDVIKRGISCNLGSLNIATVMENKRVKEATRTAIDTLTTVSDLTNIDAVPTIKKANEELHSVGLGAMNLHGYLAKNYIMYESREALDFCNVFFMMVNFYSLERSMEIAIEKGETFKDFDKSEYANGNYFEKYITKEYLPQTEKVKELFEGIHIPNIEDWKRLKEQVMKNGIYNAYRMAIAPNQSTSYIMNSTASVMPVVDTIEVREYGDSTTYYPMPYLTNENWFFYKSAYDMEQKNIINLISVIQRHVDQGISTILYNSSSDTTRDLAKLYIYAHRMGLKSLYYTRTRKAKIEECLSCSV